ncbi:hypothetical protein PSTT_04145 [Puccinia striiformis]|uniref:Uncharacterized protein n=1 Tax=Puccinia striiformis TaxID=27350 RepID=A0A2S4VTS4_9BASI|nr:hypothetical protein PSTT_04145 [Puccinia striiformis]
MSLSTHPTQLRFQIFVFDQPRTLCTEIFVRDSSNPFPTNVRHTLYFTTSKSCVPQTDDCSSALGLAFPMTLNQLVPSFKLSQHALFRYPCCPCHGRVPGHCERRKIARTGLIPSRWTSPPPAGGPHPPPPAGSHPGPAGPPVPMAGDMSSGECMCPPPPACPAMGAIAPGPNSVIPINGTMPNNATMPNNGTMSNNGTMPNNGTTSDDDEDTDSESAAASISREGAMVTSLLAITLAAIAL